MIQHPPLSVAPNEKETRWGTIYWLFSMTLLVSILWLISDLLPRPLSGGTLNFIYYCVNFAAVVVIFRKFLAANGKTALDRAFPTVYYAVLGYLANRVLTQLLGLLLYRVAPGFSNVNDQSIYEMLTEDPALIVIGTVLLVPVAEETIYRGLLFRKLFDRSKALAYTVSIAVFAAIHVAGYIGSYPPATLALCFLQYIPAGYCLCWCYRQSGSIWSPILMHILVNASGIYNFVR